MAWISILWSFGFSLCLLFIIAGSLWLGLTVYLLYIRWKYKHIPGPDTARALEFGPLYKLHLLHKVMIVVSGRDAVRKFQEVLTKKKYPKCKSIYMQWDGSSRFLGRGFVTNTNPDDWKMRHFAVAPAFNSKFLKTYLKQLVEVADLWMLTLAPLADGVTSFNMAHLIDQVTLDMITDFASGGTSAAKHMEKSRLFTSFALVLEGIELQHRDPLMKLRPSMWKFRRRVREAAVFIRDEGRKMILERRKEFEGDHFQDDDCFLTFLVKSLVENDSLDVEDILDDFVTLFIAGQETTSNTLAFIILELGRNPHILGRLQQEVEGTLGGMTEWTLDDLSRLTYMSQVIKETLRLYPVVSATAREPSQDTELNGFAVPQGTFLAIPFTVLHHLPQYYEEPDLFKPERFDPDAERPLYAFAPFSHGQRSCLGKQFAMIEMKVLLSKLLLNYEFSVDPEHQLVVQETSTLKPKGGCPITLKKRLKGMPLKES